MIITSLLLASSVSVFCNKEAEFADKVMEYRQLGHPISMVMKNAGHDKVRQLVIVMAYKEHLVEGEISKMEARFKFGDEIFNLCMGAFHETTP